MRSLYLEAQSPCIDHLIACVWNLTNAPGGGEHCIILLTAEHVCRHAGRMQITTVSTCSSQGFVCSPDDVRCVLLKQTVLLVTLCSNLFFFQEILPGLFLGPYSAAMKSKVTFTAFPPLCFVWSPHILSLTLFLVLFPRVAANSWEAGHNARCLCPPRYRSQFYQT